MQKKRDNHNVQPYELDANIKSHNYLRKYYGDKLIWDPSHPLYSDKYTAGVSAKWYDYLLGISIIPIANSLMIGMPLAEPISVFM